YRDSWQIRKRLSPGAFVQTPGSVCLTALQAGAILWFADVTVTVLVMGKVDASAGMQGFPLAIALNANFLSNQTEGSFKATSVFVMKGRTVSVVRTTVVGTGEKLIADVTTSH